MNMEQEWKELRKKIQDVNKWAGCERIKVDRLIEWMTELERHSLPERVATLLENLDPILLDEEYMSNNHITTGETVGLAVARALRTGDTSELESWQK